MGQKSRAPGGVCKRVKFLSRVGGLRSMFCADVLIQAEGLDRKEGRTYCNGSHNQRSVFVHMQE